ncbi:hypothetical protein [Streptomyces avermitilis]|uniref:hypothetical protein n=1 Tax=Streptomyces avermitilis TaxID=33903 RepID=UPI0033C5C4E4
MTALDDFIVAYGPEQIEDIEVHERPDGSALIETVSYRPVRVYERQADGSLTELYGVAADAAWEAFWQAVDDNEINNGENDR